MFIFYIFISEGILLSFFINGYLWDQIILMIHKNYLFETKTSPITRNPQMPTADREMEMTRAQRQLRRKLQIRVDRHCLHRSSDTQSGGGGRPAQSSARAFACRLFLHFSDRRRRTARAALFPSRCESSVQIIHVTCLFNQVGGQHARTHTFLTFARTHAVSVLFLRQVHLGLKRSKGECDGGLRLLLLFSLSNASDPTY
jgi:hypothetical protein